jgi:hypothetical protein
MNSLELERDKYCGYRVGLAWLASILSSSYCLLAYSELSRDVQAISSVLGCLPVELPLSTRSVISLRHSPLFAVFFMGMAVLILSKELVVRDKTHSLIVTLVFVITLLIVVNWTTRAIYSPIISERFSGFVCGIK